MPAKIIKTAEKLKRQLIRRNDAAQRQIISAYRETWLRLKPQLDMMTRQIRAEADRLGGLEELKKLHPSWLPRQARYQELMRECEAEVSRFAGVAVEITTGQQKLALGWGESDSEALVRKSLSPGLKKLGMSFTWNRVPAEALINIVGFLSDGSPLDYKFAGLGPQVAQGVRDTLAAGVAQGWNPRKIAREVRRAHGNALTNALTTCRTETMRAYRTAAHEGYQANDDVVNGWIWLSAHDGRVCPVCIALDGSFHKLSEHLNDHPSGRCVQIPSTRPWHEILGHPANGVRDTAAQPWDPEEHFAKLSETGQRQVLGRSRYEAWKAGDLKLRDIPVKYTDEVWGDGYRSAKLSELGLVKGPLPNYKNAVIPDEKLTKYVLDPTSDIGRHKAVVFQSALGYNLNNADHLAEQIRSGLRKYKARSKGRTEHGRKFEVLMAIKGPNGKTATVLTGWQMDQGIDFPRLLTAYVTKRKL